MKSTMYGLRRIQHIMYCDKISRDNLYWLDDGISSLAFGHYKIRKVMNV